MRPFRVLVLLLGLAAIGLAIAMPFQQVKTADGRSCGTAWRGARTEITSHGEHDAASTSFMAVSCKAPRNKILKQAGAVAGGGAVLLVVVAAWPSKKYRRPEVVAVSH